MLNFCLFLLIRLWKLDYIVLHEETGAYTEGVNFTSEGFYQRQYINELLHWKYIEYSLGKHGNNPKI